MNAKHINKKSTFSIDYPALKKCTILVASVNTDLENEILSSLQLLAHNVRWVTSGTHLLNILKEYTPDIVLCDLDLACDDSVITDCYCESIYGRKAICALLELYPELPIMVLTEDAQLNNVSTLLKMGIKDVLFAPFHSIRQLAEPLSFYFDNQHVEKEFKTTYYDERELLEHIGHLRSDPKALFEFVKNLTSSSSVNTSAWHLDLETVTNEKGYYIFSNYKSLPNNQLICYLIEVYQNDVNELTSALLIHLLFENYVGEVGLKKEPAELTHLIKSCEQGIQAFLEFSDLPACFYLFDFDKLKLDIMPAGLEVSEGLVTEILTKEILTTDGSYARKYRKPRAHINNLGHHLNQGDHPEKELFFSETACNIISRSDKTLSNLSLFKD